MKALFLILPASGHINACVRFSEMLRENGFTIDFLVLEEVSFALTSKIANVKFNETSFVQIPGINSSLRHTSNMNLFENIFNWLCSKNLKALQKKVASLESILVKYEPTFFFIDTFYSYFYFLLPSAKNKIIFINTQLNNYRDQLVPPINSTLRPGVERFSLKK
jgi:hypothetical protein